MQSRAKNIYGLPGYKTPHAVNQLRASVVCAREFFRELVEEGETKAVRKWFQRSYRFAAKDAAASYVFETYGVDPFRVVFTDERLGGFNVGSYPRMVAALAKHRARSG
jgi:hypothetical protein